MDFTIVTRKPDETVELGRKIGSQLKGGEIIGISGPLGAGKTHLIKGIAAGVGAENSRAVNSPTFVIVNEYQGRFDIYHIDVYRIDSIAEFEMIGFDDFCYPGSVVVIEWADKVKTAFAGVDLIYAELGHEGRSQRSVRISNLPGYILLD